MSNSFFSRIDWVTLLLYLCLVGVGFVNIYSATYEENTLLWNLNMPVGKQLLLGAVGVVGGLLFLAVSDKLYEQFAWPIYGLGILLLLGLFVF